MGRLYLLARLFPHIIEWLSLVRKGKSMKLGAHVSTTGGVDKTIDRAQEIGAEVMQFFVSSPQGWAYKPLDDRAVEVFREKVAVTGIGPNFLHCIYLINLGTSDPEHLKKSVKALTNYMETAARLGCTAVIVHPGSHGGVGFERIFHQVVTALDEVLSKSPQGVSLALENMAGMGNHIGARFSDLGHIIKALEDPRMKVCLDTQHTFAAGYKITESDGIDRVMDEFDTEIGLEKLAVVHSNDSKIPFGGGVDRHENIGDGEIGEKGFKVLMGHPGFRDVPFVMEVPGLEGKGSDKTNLDRLKQIRSELGMDSNS
jgi:deoxyribonuclease-4